MVVFENECTAPKIEFWTRFIDLYYQSTGGIVSCCDKDGCNTGANIAVSLTGGPAASAGNVPGAPLVFAPGQQQGCVSQANFGSTDA